MKITPFVILGGSTIVLFGTVIGNIIAPPRVFRPQPSAKAVPYSSLQLELISYYLKGPAQNVAHLNSTLPKQWLTMPNLAPVTQGSLNRGRVVYQSYCIGCHGEDGDGRGLAAPYLNPPPMDFTRIQASGSNPSTPGWHYDSAANSVSSLNNGAIYFAVLKGLPGSAMPSFKDRLESKKIWDVGNYIGCAFMGWKLEDHKGNPDDLASTSKSPGSEKT